MNSNLPRPTTDTKPSVVTDAVGTTLWRLGTHLHREDGPAVEYANGTKEWRRSNLRHREDGPAVEYPNGSKEWYRHNQLHRDDGPAIERPDGTKRWYLNGHEYPKPVWLREVLKDRPLTTHQRELLNALSENWAGTPESLYETVTHLEPLAPSAK